MPIHSSDRICIALPKSCRYACNFDLYTAHTVDRAVSSVGPVHRLRRELTTNAHDSTLTPKRESGTGLSGRIHLTSRDNFDSRNPDKNRLVDCYRVDLNER